MIKNCNLGTRYLSLVLGGEASALKREYPALQNMKILNFFICVCHFCPPGSVSGFMDLIEFGSNPDPDPKQCFSLNVRLVSSWYASISILSGKFD